VKNFAPPMNLGVGTASARGWIPAHSRSSAAAGFNSVPSTSRTMPADAAKSGYVGKMAYFFLWIVVFAMPWENAIVIPGFGTVSRAVGVAAFVAGVLAVLESKSVRVPTIQHKIMALFVTWATLSYFWSFDLPRTRVAAMSLVQLLVLVWLIWEFAQTRKQQLLLLRAFVLGTVVSSVSIIAAYLTGAGDANNYGRYTGMGFNPNDLSLILVLSLPISIFLAMRDEDLRFRVGIYGLHSVMAFGAMLLTASRGPLIASAGTLVIVPFAFSTLTRGQKTVAALLAAMLAVGAGFVVPKSSWARLSTIGREVSSGTLNERTMIWQAGWAVFGQSPFGGVGSGAFAPAVEHNLGMGFQNLEATDNAHDVELVAHNTFVSVLVEEGVIGLALFLGILLALALCAWKFPPIERAFWFSVLMTWLIGVSALTWENRKPTWFLFGVLAAAGVQFPFLRGNRNREAEEKQFWWRDQRVPATVRVPQYGRRS
jgi:O-antigen ligase